MKLNKAYSLLLLLSVLVFTACTDTNEENSKENDQEETASAIVIKPVGDSPEYPNAQLSIKNVHSELQGNDSVKITIDYNVSGYELKTQTPDASSKGCNNSADGQHIHFILDNNPYLALYEPSKSFTVAVNSEHYLMSFLSRSYHESLKNLGAGILFRFSVDDKGKISELEVPNEPMVFFSRPKGEYLGDDIKNVLLDFYVYNASLSPEGHKVMVTINGNEFLVDTWQAYFIQNAPEGELNIKLQLKDENGNDVQGVNTSQQQTAQLALKEPMR